MRRVNPSNEIPRLFLRLLAFSMVEPFYKYSWPVDETVGLLYGGHSYVCDLRPPEGVRDPSIRITDLLMRLLAFSMVATAMSVTLRPPEKAKESMNPSIRITYLLVRLLAFSMVATGHEVTWGGQRAHEPFYKYSWPVDETVGLLNGGHSDVCHLEAARGGQGAHEPFHTNAWVKYLC
jgi:hypothetical protein